MSRVRSVLLSCAALAGLGVAAGPAAAQSPAPASGPELAVTEAQFDAAFECSGPLTGLTRDPVLLTPAFSTADESYGQNYRRQLPAAGFTTCTLNLPDRGFGDLQRSAEYVVRAVRKMSAERGGGKVALMGHQHGALNELWAMRFWPDVAAKVSDFISLATPYYGTSSASGCRSSKSCAPATWQIGTGSKFTKALLQAPLPTGPSYTSIATAYDELILPQPATSRLPGATNITLQSICPLRPIEHFTILFDALTYRLVIDALKNDGAARSTRLPATKCVTSLYLPGLRIENFPKVFAAAAGALGGAMNSSSQNVAAEPALREYALAG